MKKFYFLTLLLIFLVIQTALAEKKTLHETWQIVRDNFYDPNFNGVDWPATLEKYGPLAEKAGSKEELYRVINLMLSELRTSHTELYSPSDPMYYMLLGIFSDASPEDFQKSIPAGRILYTEIGVFTKKLDQDTFISAILEGSPAQKAGLLVGDRIVSVEGKSFRPVESFRGKAGQKIKMVVQTAPDPNSIREVTVIPREINPSDAFLEAQKSSIRIIQSKGKRLGYIHIWSYAGERHQQVLKEAVEEWNTSQDVDGLILDIRDGLGGANPEYLDIFNKNVPSLTYVNPAGERTIRDSKWRRPVVLLINENTRSGKEAFAFGFKKYKIGTLIGTKTAGAVMGGKPFFLSDGSLLYLAVMGTLVDGERLEGVGVNPDIKVPFPLEYAQGEDPQLQKAIEIISSEIVHH